MTPTPFPQHGKSTSRDQFVNILQTSLAVEEHRYVRQAALVWLAHYPGDLQVNFLYARSLLRADLTNQAIPVLEKICQVDPEYLEAQIMLKRSQEGIDDQAAWVSSGNIYVLGEDPGPKDFLPDWAYQLRAARTALDSEKLSLAEDLIHQALIYDCPTPLAALLHLEVNGRRDLPPMTMRDLAVHYHQQWPECLACMLWSAEAFMQSEESDKAVGLLHHAAAKDVTGQVATRLWGSNHPYRSLWPTRLAAPIDVAIPAPVAAAMGWNQLPAKRTNVFPMEAVEAEEPQAQKYTTKSPLPEDEGPINEGERTSTSKITKTARKVSPPQFQAIPETLRDVQDELERVAERLKQNHIARSDGRFPVYVVFTTREGLNRFYGSLFGDIDTELKQLVSAINRREDWRALLIYADDPKITTPYGIEPAKAEDPWELKLILADLDAVLAKHGEMIGALLIVGGPEVVPFHHLPNPVDDVDVDAPSDNPYATRDENYFIPEWPVGRLPGGAQSDPEPLLQTIRGITERHLQVSKHSPWYRRLRVWLKNRIWFNPRRVQPSWGYTAAVWRRAALSVFRPIGPPHSMLVSPPVQVNGKPGRTDKNKALPTARLGYFNLHGLLDASEWYGQRDPTDPNSEPDYPVALRPEDIVNGGRAPQVVFSEACYGAHIIGKQVDEALALKFLTSGSQAVVGSTVTAYGSITPPLIAADLLGHTFWRYLREGVPAGEALRRAKIHLAREMLRRQGYLDGEDQKTLITFVCYGDPLAEPLEIGVRPKTIYRPLKRPKKIKTVCDRAMSDEKSLTLETFPPIPAETLKEVKRIVKQYLPGMQDAAVLFTHEQADCHGGNHTCPTSQLGLTSRPSR